MNKIDDESGDYEIPIMDEGMDRIPLFLPHIPKGALEALEQVLNTRWIGQGPRVEKFEIEFAKKYLGGSYPLAVGSGTDALHLAYLLAGIQPGDKVLTPLFTCTATNIPLKYIGAEPVFVDVNPHTLNIDVEDLKRKITKECKAIVVVHYGGLPCDMQSILEIAKSFQIPVIEDAAHAVGAKYKDSFVGSISDFTIFSFQAIKHITTGDGGLLAIRDHSLIEKAKKLRWFGIDRTAKQNGIWDNDITEIGYKYQMTDLGAALGLAALEEIDETLALRRELMSRYLSNFQNIPEIEVIGKPNEDSIHAAWLFTIKSKNRKKLQSYLYENGIETNQVHYRNDRYSIFGGRQTNFTNMDLIENEYLVLHLQTKMKIVDVDRITTTISNFYRITS